MANNTIVLCYINGEIIYYEFVVCYNRPCKKGISINNMITFDELELKLCYTLNIDCIHIKINMIFRYPTPFPNGNGCVNYVPIPIRDNGDTGIMFNVVAQSPPPNTIEMYCSLKCIVKLLQEIMIICQVTLLPQCILCILKL